jgi:hypothetical protein
LRTNYHKQIEEGYSKDFTLVDETFQEFCENNRELSYEEMLNYEGDLLDDIWYNMLDAFEYNKRKVFDEELWE